MPESELKTFSHRWSVNTEMRTMTAQIVFPPWKKVVGSSGWITDEVALMCFGRSLLHWCQKLDETESE